MAGVREPKQTREEEEQVAKELESEAVSEGAMSNSGAAAKAMKVRKEREQAQAGSLTSPVNNYEQTLGRVLGPKIYDAVSDIVTLEALAGYARSGLESGLGGLGKLVRESDRDDAGEYEKAIDALQLVLGPMAEQFVQQHGEELQARLQNFVDTRPVAVVALALLAAAAAVAADMEIPELKHTFKITDNVDLTAGARLGSLRNITLERISARLDIHGAKFRARAEGSYDLVKDQGQVKGDLDLKLRDDLSLYSSGQFQTSNESGRVEIDDHSVRGGVRWRPQKGMSVEGYGEHSERRGVGFGVNFRWDF
ncbi:MAG: hypothetical protein KJO07_24530 [Deltaproteobacteria bacterium]|nr:hypothetical protein [Deltaproteobacteria bacterium]